MWGNKGQGHVEPQWEAHDPPSTRFAVFVERAAKYSEAPCTLVSVRPLHCKEQRATQTTPGTGVFWIWNWEAAENKHPGPGCPPHRLQGFSPHLRPSFCPYVSFQMVFFIHNFGRSVTLICHGFSSLKRSPFILASASVAKHISGFLHSNSQDRDSVDSTYSLCQDVCHVQTMEWPPWGGGLTHTPTSNGHGNQTGGKTLGPWASPMSSAQAVARQVQWLSHRH